MLTGTVDRLDNDLTTVNGDADQQTLLAVFLNPQAYIGSGATLEEINANIIRGLSRDVGNAIDEFIVTDVRSNLLGLPLDLGALNIARGRDTGIPSLNETRAQLYDDTGLADLKPYDSWVDFAANIKNAASVVNFIAAYGTHATITVGDDAGGQARRGRSDRVRRRRARRPTGSTSSTPPAPMPDGTGPTTTAAAASISSTCGSAAWPKRAPNSAACWARPSTTCSKRRWRTCRTATGCTI